MGKNIVVLGADFSVNKVGTMPEYETAYMGDIEKWDSLSPINVSNTSIFGLLSPYNGKVVGFISYGTETGGMKMYINNGATTTNKKVLDISVPVANSKEIIPLNSPVPISQGDFIGVGFGNSKKLFRFKNPSDAHSVATYSYSPINQTIVADNDSRAFSVAFVIMIEE